MSVAMECLALESSGNVGDQGTVAKSVLRTMAAAVVWDQEGEQVERRSSRFGGARMGQHWKQRQMNHRSRRAWCLATLLTSELQTTRGARVLNTVLLDAASNSLTPTLTLMI